MYIYRFVNQHDRVIYIGRTNNIVRRIRHQHFGNNGHLPKTCYNETVYVEYAKVKSENDAKIYELYYIEKYHPKYNKTDIGGGVFSIVLEDLSWIHFEFNIDTKTHTKEELETIMQTTHQELQTERSYIESMLHQKDRVAWLTKLSTDERNEYLRLLYSVERFINNIEDISDNLNL